MENIGQPIIELKNIHMTFPGVYALKNVNFTIYPGEVHAIVGENGAGKSTLTKIIAGNYKQNMGEYYIEGQPVDINKPADAIEKGIAVVYQELNVVDALSISENVFYGRLPTNKIGMVRWKQLHNDSKAVLKRIGLDVDPERKVGTLSIAQKQMVEIAKVISKEPKVVIMDEPTSSLATTEIETLFSVIEALKNQGVSIIYISHKLNEVFRLSNRITVLRDGELITTVNKECISTPQLIYYMVGRNIEELFVRKERKLGQIALEVSGLSTNKVRDISFYVRQGEIIGFSGLMGAGRTELACALYGVDKRLKGEIKIFNRKLPPNSPYKAVRSGMGMMPESRKEDGILDNFTVSQNISISSLKQYVKGGILSTKKETKLAEKVIDEIRIKTPSVKQLVVNLSGGNQQKVLVGRWLSKENLKILITDEPTRGIDVGSKAEIYELLDDLARQGMAIIVMSSEMQEILSVCDRIYVMKTGKITGEFNRKDATQEKLISAAIFKNAPKDVCMKN